VNLAQGIRHGVSLAAAMLAVAGILTSPGCGEPVSARTQSRTVTQWKHAPGRELGISRGLVIEQRGEVITARFCHLQSGPGFAVHSTIAQGKYLPDRKAMVFPLGMPQSTTAEEWIRGGGAHLMVPFRPNQSRLTGTLVGTGSTQTLEFVNFR
jgi:hypothetical protein